MSTAAEKRFKRIDGVLLPILFRSPLFQPAAVSERLDGLEAAFIGALREAGCWDESASDINMGRFFGLAHDAQNLSHRAKAARARVAIHAANGLCAARKLRALAGGKKDLLSVVALAMLAEGAAAQIKFEPAVAAASGSRRERSPDELRKHELSAALYRLAELAHRGGDLKVTSGHANFYEVVAAEAKEEVYWPRGSDGFRKQLSKWRRLGLIE